MINIVDVLNKETNHKYSFLKLYEVNYTKSNLECVITFLYPHTVNEIIKADREEILSIIKKHLQINGKISVKFKKSFLDERLIKKEVADFITANFKAGAVYINDQQINVKNSSLYTQIELVVGDKIKSYLQDNFFSKNLGDYLNEKFIAEFVIEIKSDKSLDFSDEIGDVEIPVINKKNTRYKAFVVKPLFGGDISPDPEFIKDNTEAKSAVILAGNISNFQKKTFVKKKGKQAGQEGTYYTFTLDDGKKIECVYFSSKANVAKMDLLADNSCVLCLGDFKPNLSNKLTYYISKIALATIDEESKLPKKEVVKNHKITVKEEDFIETKQSDFFTKEASYNDYIKNNTFVVYDLETTGIDPAVDKIIEIGAVKIENGRVTKKFSTFVNPLMHIPEEASRVNNITDQMVCDAPTIDLALPDFLSFAKGCVLSGYNIINFDNKFISKCSKELGLIFDNVSDDVYNIVREKKLKSKNYKLSSVVEALGISLVGAHRAYNDAYATAQVLLKLNEM